MPRFIIPFLALLILAGCNKEETAELSITAAYSFAARTQTGAAFITINNAGGADRLVGASSDIAESVEMHTMSMEGGTMVMRSVDGFDIPTRGQLTLNPGGNHLMLIGLKQPLKEGDTYDLTLTFESSAQMTFPVMVSAAGKRPEQSHEDHNHDENEHTH